MRTWLITAAAAATLFVAGAAVAADQPEAANPQATDTTSALPAPQQGVDEHAPLPGANSFTQAQVEARLQEQGFTEISSLTLDSQGIWRGRATLKGSPYDVAFDYRGNIVYGNTIISNLEPGG